MTLDSSALLAIVFGASGHLELVDRILMADSVRIGAPTLAEVGLVLTARRKRTELGDLDALVEELGVTIVPFTDVHYAEAVPALRSWTPPSGAQLRRLSQLCGRVRVR
jgi:ribonuclease VapC